MSFISRTFHRGFTLIELLLVIAIIVVLASIVLVAINPSRNLAQANNAERWSAVNTILNAVHQYAVDNAGSIPSTITSGSTEICRTGAASCSGLVDLSALTFEERYVLQIPIDPTSGSANGTGYFINKTPYNRVTVSSPYAQLGTVISVSR